MQVTGLLLLLLGVPCGRRAAAGRQAWSFKGLVQRLRVASNKAGQRRSAASATTSSGKARPGY